MIPVDDVIKNADCPSHIIFRVADWGFVAAGDAGAGGGTEVVAGLPGAPHATRTSREIINRRTNILMLFTVRLW